MGKLSAGPRQTLAFVLKTFKVIRIMVNYSQIFKLQNDTPLAVILIFS